MKSFLKIAVITGALVLARPTPSTAEPLQTGSEAFRDGDFAKAAEHFEEVVASGQQSAGLFYNLGLAQKQSGDPAKASLNLRRALMIDPLMVDARMALSDLERSQGIPFAPVDWKANLAEHVPLLPILVAGFVIFWLGAFWLLYLVIRRNRRVLPALAGILFCVLGAVLFLAGYASDPRFLWRTGSVALEPSDLLAAPADRSEVVARIPAGSMLHVLRTSGNWAYGALPDGTKGWTQAQTLAALVPPRE